MDAPQHGVVASVVVERFPARVDLEEAEPRVVVLVGFFQSSVRYRIRNGSEDFEVDQIDQRR